MSQILFDYRGLLRAELKKRKALTPKYSLRDMAKNIGISASHLSYVLRNRRGLSRRTALLVARSLGFAHHPERTAIRKDFVSKSYMFLVSAISGRSPEERNLARLALRQKIFQKGLQCIRLLIAEIASWENQARIWVNRRAEDLIYLTCVSRRVTACHLN